VDEITQLSGQLSELAYALDTFYFLVMGALVMWMAAGFTMLEAGLVRAKNTAEILTKNVGLYSIASIMYMACGYSIMYPGDFAGGVFQSLSTFGSGMLGSTDNDPASVIAGDAYYSNLSDFFFQVALGIFPVCRFSDGLYLPSTGILEMGRRLPRYDGLSRFRGLGCCTSLWRCGRPCRRVAARRPQRQVRQKRSDQRNTGL